MFTENQIEEETQEFCSKFNLNYRAFLVIKEIVMSNGYMPEMYEDIANLFFMECDHFNFEHCSHLIVEKIKKSNTYVYSMIRHGDILFNTALNAQGEYDGLYFFVKSGASGNNTGDFTLIKSIDNRIPSVFKAIDEFPVSYWEDPNDIIISGKKVNLLIFNFDSVPISDKLYSRIQPMTIRTLEFILRHDTNYLFGYDDVSQRKEECLNNRTIRYNNKLYIISGESESLFTRDPPGYIPIDENFYEIDDLPSRWGIFKALIWLLVLHKRAVVRVNHPDRLKQLGTFEEL